MVEDIRGELDRLGARGRIHVEHFTPVGEAPASCGRSSAGTAAGSCRAVRTSAGADHRASVTVVMDGRRRTLRRDRGGEFVLDAAGRAGIDLPFSCRAGVCSTCRAKLGARYRDWSNNVALEDWEVEAGYILCCQARPTSPALEISYDE